MRVGETLIQTLWVGSVWTVGYLVAPALFEHLDSRAMAGRVAGELFTLVTWLSIVCGGLLFAGVIRDGIHNKRPRLRGALIMAMMILLGASEWLVRPLMEAARLPDGTPGDGFAMLHGVSAVLYLLGSLAGVCLVVSGAYVLNIRHIQNGKNWLAPFLAITRERGSRLMLAAAVIYSFTSVAGKAAMQYATPQSFGPFYFILIGACVFAMVLVLHPKRLPAIWAKPSHTLTVGAFMAAMVITHFIALAMIEVAYMIAVKRTSLLFGIIFGAILFHERNVAQHFIAGAMMVLGVSLILL